MQERRAVAPLARTRVVTRATIAAVVVVALDQLTKSWAVDRLSDGDVHIVGPIDLSLTYNSGAAFSLGPGLTPFLIAAGVVLLAVLIGMTRSVENTPTAVALGVLIGGACGNLADRLFRDHDGAVVDFVDVGWWPVFNVADAALVCGGICLVLFGATRREAEDAPG